MEYFEAIYCICMQDRPKKKERLLNQLKHFFPDIEPVVFDAINTRDMKPKGHHIGCALSHRNVVEEARDKGYRRIMVFEEDALLHIDFKNEIQKSIRELRFREWDLFYLGAHCQRNIKERPFPKEKKCNSLSIATGVTCTHGICYNHSFYNFLINKIPKDIKKAEEWCRKSIAIDQWFRYFQNRKNKNFKAHAKRHPIAYINEPILATQPFMTTKYGKNRQDNFKHFWRE